MALANGTRLGPYEILAPIGAGGMGEVYRARDTRLERTVAIKVLPAHLSANPELRQRFEREARTISSLNHPPPRRARNLLFSRNCLVDPMRYSLLLPPLFLAAALSARKW